MNTPLPLEIKNAFAFVFCVVFAVVSGCKKSGVCSGEGTNKTKFNVGAVVATSVLVELFVCNFG